MFHFTHATDHIISLYHLTLDNIETNTTSSVMCKTCKLMTEKHCSRLTLSEHSSEIMRCIFHACMHTHNHAHTLALFLPFTPTVTHKTCKLIKLFWGVNTDKEHSVELLLLWVNVYPSIIQEYQQQQKLISTRTVKMVQLHIWGCRSTCLHSSSFSLFSSTQEWIIKQPIVLQ